MDLRIQTQTLIFHMVVHSNVLDSIRQLYNDRCIENVLLNVSVKELQIKVGQNLKFLTKT